MQKLLVAGFALTMIFAGACTPQLKVEGLSVVETFCLKYEAVGTEGLSGDQHKLDTIEGNDAVWYEDCFVPSTDGANEEGDSFVSGSIQWFEKQVDLIVGEDEPAAMPVVAEPEVTPAPEEEPASDSSGAAAIRVIESLTN